MKQDKVYQRVYFQMQNYLIREVQSPKNPILFILIYVTTALFFSPQNRGSLKDQHFS